MSYILVAPTKECSCCAKELPITHFERQKTSRDGRRSKCRKCRFPQNKAKQKRWRASNRERINAYYRNWNASRRAQRPIPHCSSEHSGKFFWLNGQWQCRVCQRNLAKSKERTADRAKRTNRQAKRLETEFGPKFALAYLKLVATHPKKSTSVRLVEIIRLLLPVAYRRFRVESIERIYQLNRLLALPVWNVGWTCQRCATYSADFRFFDIDHVTPAFKGGHGRLSNKQVLCPNCHRRKTICDVYGSILDPNALIPTVDPRKEGRDAEIHLALTQVGESAIMAVESGVTRNTASVVPSPDDCPTRSPSFLNTGESLKLST